MKIKNKKLFYLGIAILVILAFSYIIKIPLDSGTNYKTITSLLGILIFYNPFILGLYILVAGILIFKGYR